jgi:hypothetical protein
MFQSASGASTHAPRPSRTGMSATLSPGPTAGPDDKQLPSARDAAPGSYVLAVVKPWLKERKALDLRKNAATPPQLTQLLTPLLDPAREMSNARTANALRGICRVLGDPIAPPQLKAVVDCVHTAALRREGWLAGCQFAYDMLACIAQPPCEKTLTSLLAALLPDSERPPAAATMVTAWFELAAKQYDEDRLMAFLVRALGQVELPQPPVLFNAVGRIATQWMLRLGAKPDQMLPQFGQLVGWLLRQPPEHAQAGLSGLGQGLNAGAHGSPRHLCEMLQTVNALRADFQSAGLHTAIRGFVDDMAGDDGLQASHAQSLLALLDERTRGARPMPRDEVLATLDGMVWGTLATDMTAPQVAAKGPPLGRIARLACLSSNDLEHVGQTVVQALGGQAIDPAVLGALGRQLAAIDAAEGGHSDNNDTDIDADAHRRGALLRGMVAAAGGPALDDAHLMPLAKALGSTDAGIPLVAHVAQALGAAGPARETVLAQLASRLQVLMPAAGPLRLGMALARDPLAAVHDAAMQAQDAIRLLSGAWRLPGALDEGRQTTHLWHCALLAADNGALAIGAAGLLIERGPGVTVDGFRELRSALLAQALAEHPDGPPQAWANDMAGLYRRFLAHGVFDSAHTSNSQTAPKTAAKAKVKKPPAPALPQHPAPPPGSHKFLQEEITWLGLGLAQAPMRPLVDTLRTLARSPVAALDSKY